MLVLNRRQDQNIIITTPQGQRIVVSVAEIRSDCVRLGVIADKSIRIDREEIDTLRRASAATSAQPGS